MTLPKINHPVFKINIPSLKKDFNFRPYTVKEEKLLMMVKSSEDIKDAVETLKQIINNCCVDKINVDKLAVFDIEYIFIKLRARSVSDIVELVLTKNEQETKFKVDLNKVEIKYDSEHKQSILLFNDVGVNMSYPTFETMLKLEQKINSDESLDDFLFDVFVDCIESVFDDKKVYKDHTKQELTEFVLSLPRTCVDDIKKFFDTMPKLEHTVDVKFKDGTTDQAVLRGLKDFFIF